MSNENSAPYDTGLQDTELIIQYIFYLRGTGSHDVFVVRSVYPVAGIEHTAETVMTCCLEPLTSR